MQAYACVCDTHKRFIVARKNVRGYWFDAYTNRNGVRTPPTVYPAGHPLANGPGLPCLPGGSADTDEGIEAAARREWMEETTVPLAQARCAKTQTWVQDDYGAAYFVLQPIDFNRLFASVNNALAALPLVRQAVINKVVRTYHQLRTQYPHAPPSDELASVAVWDLNGGWDTAISQLGNSRATNWYRNIIFILATLKV